MRSSLVVLSLLVCALGCGSSPAPPPNAAPVTGGPGEHCLAVAGAKHDPKPDQPTKVSAKHILVKYAGAKKAAPTVTRSREEACLRAEEARSKLEGGMSFGDAVKTYSEEPGAATREGTLGAIQRTDVVAPFANAAFELKAGEVSQVVETDFGFHVILRTE